MWQAPVKAELLQQLPCARSLIMIFTHVSLASGVPHRPSKVLARWEPPWLRSEARTLCRMAATELADNRERLTRSLKAVEAKLQTQRRVGPIPVSAHIHHGGGTAQCVQTRHLARMPNMVFNVVASQVRTRLAAA